MTDTPQTIFIVDDDEAVRDSLQLLLRSVGLPTELYDSGQHFLNSYDPERPGCLILDVRVPGMSGLDLAQALRECQVLDMLLEGHINNIYV